MHQKLGEIVSALNATRDKRFQLEQDRDLSSQDFPPNVRLSSSNQLAHSALSAMFLNLYSVFHVHVGIDLTNRDL